MSGAEIGARGEALARQFYEEQGYTLLQANFRTRQGEVDLILERAGMLVFTEVKARTEGAIASPREWVDARKQRRVMAAALAWLAQNRLSDPPLRFDVVEVCFDKKGEVTSIQCIEGAFTA